MLIDRITHNDRTIAIIIPNDFSKEGIHFFTPDDFSQQLAFMKRQKGYKIHPHIHNIATRKVEFTQEVLFVKSGKVRVDFYDDNKIYFQSRVLNKGDVILLASGGHGFEMLEESEIIEVKQGPYLGEEDKVRFETVKRSQIRVPKD